MKDEKLRDRVRGCLIGGAAGDALGYPVEFLDDEEICRRFGGAGIRTLVMDRDAGRAIVSDDTQMTLFTANGLLLGVTNPGLSMESWIYHAYLDWLDTQWSGSAHTQYCWLLKEKALFARRAPGNTCLTALRSGDMGSVDEPINNSKGCGGVMRVAPVGVLGHVLNRDPVCTARLAAEAAAVTHGHPLGWLSAAALADMVQRILDGTSPREAAEACIFAMPQAFSETRYADELAEGLREALRLAGNGDSDKANIARLGEGWVGEEALYIAVYCAVRYSDDFDAALIASVNHPGDSDSTGAITGNLLGAWIGLENMSAAWTEDLELRSTILEIADDLCDAGRSSGEDWNRKYRRDR